MTLTTILLILLIIDLALLIQIICGMNLPDSIYPWEQPKIPRNPPENPFKENPSQAERVSKLMQKYGLKYREHLDEP